MEAEHYGDIGTSAGPILSIILDQKAQPFAKKIGEFSPDELDRLKLWVKTRYKFDEDSLGNDGSVREIMYKMYKTTDRASKQEATKQKIERFERSIQNKMWSSVISEY